MIGTGHQFAYFVSQAAEAPSLELLVSSREQVEHYSAERSKAVYADLMKRAWRPN
ncbi:MAG: hypothetical protein ABI609_06060 [Acidobacteriota bacterium]